MASSRDYKDGPVRIDARVGESRLNGVRNAQRDMGGNIVGGIMPDGTRLGMTTTPVKTPAGQQPAWRNNTGSITPRLDGGSPTPRLDATRDPATVGESFAQTDARKKAESARSGAFGARQQNLQGRKDLFAQMQYAGGSGITPDMQKQAKKLGVSDAAWNRVAGGIKPNAIPSPITGKMESPAFTRGMAQKTPLYPAAPSAPDPAPVPSANKPTPIIPAPVRPTSGTALAQQPGPMTPFNQSPAWMRPMPTGKPMVTPPARPAAPPSMDPLERRMTANQKPRPRA